MDISKVDLTNRNQKLLAGVLLIGAILFINWVLPSLIFFLKNVWLAIGLLVPLAFVVYNYPTVWMIFKQLSWNMTKFMVSKDKLGFMYQYLEYLNKKTDKLNESVLSIGAMEVKLSRKIKELEQLYQNNIAQHVELKDRGASKLVLSSLENKIDIDKKRIDVLGPQVENIKRQKNYLIELHDAWVYDNEALKYKLDAKAEEFKLLKEIAEATGNASEFLKGNSEEFKLYQESLIQIEDSVSTYTSNIENFERKVAPILETLSSNRSVSSDEGKKLIEEYNKNRVSFKIEE